MTQGECGWAGARSGVVPGPPRPGRRAWESRASAPAIRWGQANSSKVLEQPCGADDSNHATGWNNAGTSSARPTNGARPARPRWQPGRPRCRGPRQCRGGMRSVPTYPAAPPSSRQCRRRSSSGPGPGRARGARRRSRRPPAASAVAAPGGGSWYRRPGRVGGVCAAEFGGRWKRQARTLFKGRRTHGVIYGSAWPRRAPDDVDGPARPRPTRRSSQPWPAGSGSARGPGV